MTDPRSAPAVASRVRALLERDGWTQRRFAAAIGLDETKLSKSLAGRRRFAAAELVSIADVTGETVNRLLHGRDDARTHTAVPAGAAASSASSPSSSDGTPAGAGAGTHGARRTRRRILDAAWRLIADHGYHRVRTADVARECGTSPAAIHYHFPTRSQLLDEALRHNVKLAFDRQVAELGEITDPHRRLLQLIDLQLPQGELLRREWSIWIQVWAESAIDPARRELYWDSYDRWYRSVLMTLQDGAATGVFVAGRAEPLAHQLTALIDGLGIQVMAGTPGTGPAEMRAVLHDFIDRAVLAAPGHPSAETDRTENG
ncbi:MULTISPECIES: TetR/AcrR family transcriptional regulator [Pseudonocardia]|uniref:Transcriptional regulator BetI n=2 Tax=Pseudonocardia TaxID=1847 RepID=A0A1Y2N7K5_PSEAH|nr:MULTISPECIES: TetR/AcrR family transcriptional regulator [Pseudonocardia]OSY43171.1 transcriptional regulator BetI [Pseudonocardia autotrophica]TDN71659.1 TetR family transcriptional regulator [Pseudonocardia autotrophica]BBG02346.1 TetR family transcriptional regulator [Pseudonocardia autotrophica]GEC23318.1 TetR family transcriptional regulator [Pseudonocardia saturnea]